MPRKQHNTGAFIDPRVVENLRAKGFSLDEIAASLKVDPKTLYHRNGRNPELRKAWSRGNYRNSQRKAYAAAAAYSDVIDLLEDSLYEMAAEVREMRGRVAA